MTVSSETSTAGGMARKSAPTRDAATGPTRAGDSASRSLLPRPEYFLRAAFGGVVIVVAAHFAALYISYAGGQFERQLARLFLLDYESNFATLFNFSLFVVASAAAGLAAMVAFRTGDFWRWHWGFLAAVMLLLSYDEASLLHEKFIPFLARYSWAHGPLYFAWVVPGFIFVTLFGLSYLGFLRALPRRIGGLMLVSGLVFVSGALGMEMLGGIQFEANDGRTLLYWFISTAEETLEMSGLVLFTYAVLCWLASETRDLRWTLAAD